ncbi:hypothetical protein [Chamaesiphon sp. VAR_69_metabat_338]|uniref:hypothetical protein n=1 Tax=Chamaesiphon sp. VAR_69_metabat_338 TaxID=2964704 RepID=UPI00286E38B7|nr:hypothetical protein [Chamaesiphon sp. VAR_69_metabat_338]
MVENLPTNIESVRSRYGSHRSPNRPSCQLKPNAGVDLIPERSSSDRMGIWWRSQLDERSKT